MHDFFMNIKEKNKDALFELLRDNKDTEFGKKHHFSDIHSIREYQNQVPLSQYDYFHEYICKMIDGNRNELTAYPLVGYCLTSGSTGDRKYIPLTEEEMLRYHNHTEMYKNRNFYLHKGKRLVISQFRTVPYERTNDPLLFTEIFYRSLTEKGLMPDKEYAGGINLLFQKEKSNNFYAKVWMGFSTENIVQIESIYLYDSLLFFGYMQNHWQEILEDMKSGNISEEYGVSEDVRKILMQNPITKSRYEYVKNTCENGFENIAKRLWPELSLISGISHPSYKSENRLLTGYVGDIPRNYYIYCSSECLVGICNRENDYGFLLSPGCGFYEFLPYEPLNEMPERTYLPEELKEGAYYEMVISNFGGLYRYRMGDILYVRNIENGVPLLEFAFRKNQALNLAGEKTSIMMVEKIIEKISDETCTVNEYCAGISKSAMPGRYLFIISSETKVNVDLLEKISNQFDSQLMEINVDYADLRRLGYIDSPKVNVLSQEKFRAMKQKIGMFTGHTKPQHIAKEGTLEEYI